MWQPVGLRHTLHENVKLLLTFESDKAELMKTATNLASLKLGKL
jgi:hypothetical protein